MEFLPASICPFSSSIRFCSVSSAACASAFFSSICERASSNCFLPARISSFSLSFPAICFCKEACLTFKCSSLPVADKICSFKTLICPSSFPRITLVSERAMRSSSILRSSSSSSSAILSYSDLIFSYSFVVLLKSSDATAYFSFTSSNCSLSRAFSSKNIFTSRVFNSSFCFKYIFAFSDCFSKGPICFSSSVRISLIRTILAFSSSSFF